MGPTTDPIRTATPGQHEGQGQMNNSTRTPSKHSISTALAGQVSIRVKVKRTSGQYPQPSPHLNLKGRTTDSWESLRWTTSGMSDCAHTSRWPHGLIEQAQHTKTQAKKTHVRPVTLHLHIAGIARSTCGSGKPKLPVVTGVAMPGHCHSRRGVLRCLGLFSQRPGSWGAD